MKTNPLLLIDFYKSTHHEQYPKGLTKMVSYFTPRMSRLEGQDKLVMFGLQAFIKEYLIENFNEYFFGRPKDEVLNEYSRVLDNTLGKGAYDLNKIADLYDLGYLPLEIRAIPEGSRVNIKVPMIEISNTHPNFVWLVNTIETMMSCTLWHTMLSANVGYNYRNIVNKYYSISVDDNVSRARALGDFSMRGQESVESATKSSAAFCLSFLNTATVPTIIWLENNYNCDCSNESVAYGAISTEHSVMCSNYAIDGDEISFVRRLLTEIYPHHSFSMVSDSYDYWNLVDNILPQLKDEIMAHDGFIAIRGDSGDPVQIVTETVEHLWNTFGGTINSKGYKVLDSHVKALYGDSITPQRCQEIMYVNNELGTTNDIKPIYEFCQKRGILFHSDCVQAVGTELIELGKTADMVSISGHKIHAPKGVGCLCTLYKKFLSNMIYGGQQEFGIRPGTENVADIAAFGMAMQNLAQNRDQINKQIDTISLVFGGKLLQRSEECGLKFKCNTSTIRNTSKILSLRFDSIDAETLVVLLGKQGVCVAAGSACSSHSVTPSHVLKAIGLSDEDARSTIRVSFSEYNTIEEVEEAASIIVDCAKTLQSMAE